MVSGVAVKTGGACGGERYLSGTDIVEVKIERRGRMALRCVLAENCDAIKLRRAKAPGEARIAARVRKRRERIKRRARSLVEGGVSSLK